MITFTIGTFTDQTGKYNGIQQFQIATLLASASTALSASLVGNATVSLDVTISSLLGGAFATGGAKSSVHYSAKPGVNVIQNTVQDEIINGVNYAQTTAVLNLTDAFMTALSDPRINLAGSYLSDVVEHELTHALGFNGYLDSTTGAAVDHFGGGDLRAKDIGRQPGRGRVDVVERAGRAGSDQRHFRAIDRHRARPREVGLGARQADF